MVETAPLSQQIEDALRQEIVTGELAPGQRIAIEELAAKWGVSSTPVRDAIRRLEAVGFVKVAPRRGVFVSSLDEKTFNDIFRLRTALECLAVETAVALLPDEEIERARGVYSAAGQHFEETGDRSKLIECDHLVHDLIVQYSDNPKLIDMMHDLRGLMDWARGAVVTRQIDSYEGTLPGHLQLLAVLQRRDPAAAVEAVRRHLLRAVGMDGSHPQPGLHGGSGHGLGLAGEQIAEG